MNSKLYVGNLPYSVRDHDLQQAFLQFGSIVSVKVMLDKETGRSKGFGFVEMSNQNEASAAINAMNGQPLGGRNLVVNEARPLESRRSQKNDFSSATPNKYPTRTDGSFRSPYSTGPRNRGPQENSAIYGQQSRNPINY